MRNNYSTLGLLLMYTLLSAFIFLSVQPQAVANEAVGIKTMKKGMLGTFLADGKGITLYTYSKDTINVSNCTEGCAFNWPPFHVDPAAVIEGCASSDFATITRTDGRQQTTYKGMPLYYFKNDKYPGDTLGQGIGDVWFVILLEKSGGAP